VGFAGEVVGDCERTVETPAKSTNRERSRASLTRALGRWERFKFITSPDFAEIYDSELSLALAIPSDTRIS
jgi:hypothetical protein